MLKSILNFCHPDFWLSMVNLLLNIKIIRELLIELNIVRLELDARAKRFCLYPRVRVGHLYVHTECQLLSTLGYQVISTCFGQMSRERRLDMSSEVGWLL